MLSRRLRIHLLLALGMTLLVAPRMMAHDDEEMVVVRAGQIITITGEVIEQGTIVIVDGRIEAVGANVEYPLNATIIDARDETVMPGFIHPGTRANLPGYSRNGVNAHRLVTDEVYVSELDLDRFVENGFTAAALKPAGSGLPGQAALYHTAGAHDARVIDGSLYLVAPFTSPGRDKGALRSAFRKAKSEIEKIDKARAEWEKKQKEKAAQQKRAEEQKKKENGGGNGGEGNGQSRQEEEEKPAEQPEPEEFKPPQIQAGYEPVVDLLRDPENATPLLLDVSNATCWVHLTDLLAEGWEDVPRTVSLQSRSGDFNHVVDDIAEHADLVIATAQMSVIPMTVIEYNVPAELIAAGCQVALVPTGDNARSLAGFRSSVMELVRNGLSRDDALRSMTINVASAFGVDDRFGSIEEGKVANFMFLDGDALDPLAEVTHVMIGGEMVWTKEGVR